MSSEFLELIGLTSIKEIIRDANVLISRELYSLLLSMFYERSCIRLTYDREISRAQAGAIITDIKWRT